MRTVRRTVRCVSFVDTVKLRAFHICQNLLQRKIQDVKCNSKDIWWCMIYKIFAIFGGVVVVSVVVVAVVVVG